MDPVGSASLTSENGGAAEAPVRGEFNDQVDLLLSYASWIGLGVCVFGVLFLGIVLATNARRGDGAGLVNTATVLASGAALIGGATSLIGFLVPARAGNLSGSVGFIQDQTFYLTLAVAALSVMIAGAQMAWTQRAEPARDLLKNLLTLAVVTASGVTILNVLVAGTDALAVQIIDSAIGEDFQTDVLKLLALDNAHQRRCGGSGVVGRQRHPDHRRRGRGDHREHHPVDADGAAHRDAVLDGRDPAALRRVPEHRDGEELLPEGHRLDPGLRLLQARRGPDLRVGDQDVHHRGVGGLRQRADPVRRRADDDRRLRVRPARAHRVPQPRPGLDVLLRR